MGGPVHILAKQAILSRAHSSHSPPDASIAHLAWMVGPHVIFSWWNAAWQTTVFLTTMQVDRLHTPKSLTLPPGSKIRVRALALC